MNENLPGFYYFTFLELYGDMVFFMKIYDASIIC
jgi:hypothetical protein